jgi:hypothetical protein
VKQRTRVTCVKRPKNFDFLAYREIE